VDESGVLADPKANREKKAPVLAALFAKASPSPTSMRAGPEYRVAMLPVLGARALVVTGDRETSQQMADDLEVWLGTRRVVYLPQQDILAFDRNSPEPALVGDFLEGLGRIKAGGEFVIVTSVAGLRQRIMAPGVLQRATLRLRCGQSLRMDVLCRLLAERGYRPAGMVAKVGDYARRGGLLDVFTVQFGIGRENLLHGLARRQHFQHDADGDARAVQRRLTETDGRVDANSI